MLTYPLNLTYGPGPLLAFAPQPDPDALAAHAVALANTDGGMIVIGLDAAGTYTGPLDGGAVARALRAAVAMCAPAIPLDQFEVTATPGGPAILVRVARGTAVHALPDGRVLVRTVAANRVLHGDEIRALVSARSNGDFEADRVPGARVSDLDPDILAEFLVHRAHQLGQPWQQDAGDLLLRAGAVTPDHHVTVAGMLLFGRAPQRWLPDSGARLVRFVGPAGDDSSPPAVDQTIHGPLARVIEGLTQAILAQMRTYVRRGEPERRDYPLGAVREALINAVAHRDYRLRGESITVCMYPDRMEITSPGGLPGYMTTAEHLLGGRYSRNPRINAVLHHWGYVSMPGRGLWNLLHTMDSPRPPQIEAGPYAVTVRLFSITAPVPVEAAAPSRDLVGLNERQQGTLDYVRQRGSVTFHELRALYGGVRAEVLQRELSALVESGHLRKVGLRRNAYYILP